MRKSVGQAPTAGEQTQQKPCRTRFDIGSEGVKRHSDQYCRAAYNYFVLKTYAADASKMLFYIHQTTCCSFCGTVTVNVIKL
jgi:3-phenylpropionate/cinnamic acid dioxygenase small subunit